MLACSFIEEELLISTFVGIIRSIDKLIQEIIDLGFSEQFSSIASDWQLLRSKKLFHFLATGNQWPVRSGSLTFVEDCLNVINVLELNEGPWLLVILIEFDEALLDSVLKEVLELQFPAMFVDADEDFILLLWLSKWPGECSKEDATAFSSSFLLGFKSFDDEGLPLDHDRLLLHLLHELINILFFLKLDIAVSEWLSIVVLFDF